MRFGSRKRFAVFFLSLILVTVVLIALAGGALRKRPERFIVLRVDDIQDFAFRDAQLFLLHYGVEADLELSLGVISGMLGEDIEVLEAVRLAINSGSEVGIHGLKHEDLGALSVSEQRDLLFQARSRIRQQLGVNARLLIPPMFSFNNDTLSVMREVSCNIISTCVDYDEPRLESDIKEIPATVELSILCDGVWKIKSSEVVVAEVERSFELYGYAAIVTHPQEFCFDGKLNQPAAESLVSLVEDLRETCQFTTFEKLAADLSF